MGAAYPFLPNEKDVAAWPERSAERQDLESQRGVARTRVYRIIAALNGIDIEAHVSPREGVYAPMLMTRDLFVRLQTAVMNETVFTALAKVVGENEANTLLGELAAL